jgi:hypothetical protein
MGELEFERGQRDLKDIFPSLSHTHMGLWFQTFQDIKIKIPCSLRECSGPCTADAVEAFFSVLL